MPSLLDIQEYFTRWYLALGQLFDLFTQYDLNELGRYLNTTYDFIVLKELWVILINFGRLVGFGDYTILEFMLAGGLVIIVSLSLIKWIRSLLY